MKIAHALHDENGKAHGGLAGDQTGKEILTEKWYKISGGWQQCLVPKKRMLAEHACTFAENIAKYNFGYSQDAGKNGRWSGYDAIRSGAIEDGVGNFDCSSFVLSCYKLADPHLDLPEKEGYTKNVARLLTETGLFELFEDAEHLTDPELVPKGTVYCVPGRHVIICIEDGEKYQGEETPRRELIRAKGSVRIRETPKTGKTLAIAHKGDVIEVFGKDEASGWYRTNTGFITANERYVESV